MNNNYIDLSYQDSSVLLKENEILNLNIDFKNNSNFNKNGDLIEGFGNFGRVNLEKCCPLEYMWSENQKKCVKVCDGCSIDAYGDINYEFLEYHGNEFMSFFKCRGDASGAYDFDKINRRYGADEIVTQYDLNYHIDSDEETDGVQPAEENPWSDVTGGMYTSDTNQQMNIRRAPSNGNSETWNYYLDCDEETGVCTTETGNFERITDDGINNQENLINDIEENRGTICNGIPGLTFNNGEDNINVCNENEPDTDVWDNLCGSIQDGEAFESLTYSIDGNDHDLDSFCSTNTTLCNDNNKLLRSVICIPDTINNR